MEPTAYNILVVDDNTDILGYIDHLLHKEYLIYKAQHASEAFRILNDAMIHLIISDVMMPDVDGLTFCSQVKKDHRHCHIPVILLTAKNTLQDKIDGLEHGADAYIEKPFSPQYLKAQISNLLISRQLLRTHIANSPVINLYSISRSNADFHLIEQFNRVVLDNIDNTDLDIDFIASKLNMSRATFYRKTKGLFDLSPQELITLTRLKKAAELLKDGTCTLNDVYSQVGFNSYNYFSTLFHKQFAITPLEFLKSGTATSNEPDV